MADRIKWRKHKGLRDLFRAIALLQFSEQDPDEIREADAQLDGEGREGAATSQQCQPRMRRPSGSGVGATSKPGIGVT